MTRLDWLLAGVIAAELAVGGYLAASRLREKTPPIPDLALIEPLAAGEVAALAQRASERAGPEDWKRLGEVYLATGYFPEAEACYRESAGRSDDADTAFRHAFALERLGRLDEANAAYRRAAERGHRRAADCWYYVGRNHLRAERAGEAREAFARAGDLPAARYELAKLDAREGRRAEAAAAASQLAGEHPAALQPPLLLYRLQLPAGAEAADRFRRAPARLPNPFDAESKWATDTFQSLGAARHSGEGARLLKEGRLDPAGRSLREALHGRWDPADADQLAEIAFQRNRPDEALRLIEEVVNRAGPSYDFLWRLGDAHEALGKPDAARAAWERAARLATGPDAKDLFFKLSTVLEKAGEPDAARAYLARAYLAAGRGEFDKGKFADAAAAFRGAVEQEPQLAHAWYYLGEVHRSQRRFAEARAAYGRCLQIDPDHGRAARGLALLPPKGGSPG
jgi:tetratricopeptide (TPR) repeat protein